MRERESTMSEDAQVSWVASERFAAYAEADLDRWRQVVGQQAQHRDPQWGTGLIEAVTWGSCCEHVPAYVQIRIRYDGDLMVTAHSKTWHVHHLRVSVPPVVSTTIRRCLSPSLTLQEQADCLLQHARELREQQDKQALDRVAARKRRNGATSG